MSGNKERENKKNRPEIKIGRLYVDPIFLVLFLFFTFSALMLYLFIFIS